MDVQINPDSRMMRIFYTAVEIALQSDSPLPVFTRLCKFSCNKVANAMGCCTELACCSTRFKSFRPSFALNAAGSNFCCKMIWL